MEDIEVMDTWALALLLERLNQTCACEKGKPEYQCKQGELHRWWREE